MKQLIGPVVARLALATCLVAMTATATVAAEPRLQGSYAGKGKTYSLEGEALYFLAVAFDGEFTYDNARAAWVKGKRAVQTKGTLTTRQKNYRTDKSHHILIGWWYPDGNRSKERWIAATNGGTLTQLQNVGGVLNKKTITKKRGVVRYIDAATRRTLSSPAWEKRSDAVRGFSVTLAVACDNDTGDIAVAFDPPR